MNILAAIKREERKLEKQVGKLQEQLGGPRAAAKALANSAANEVNGGTGRRMLSAEARRKISAAAKGDGQRFGRVRRKQ